VERAKSMSLLRSYPHSFVGSGEGKRVFAEFRTAHTLNVDLLRVFDVELAAARMQRLGKLRDDFRATMQPLRVMYDKMTQYRLCGRYVCLLASS
jgi:hypothetical protein